MNIAIGIAGGMVLVLLGIAVYFNKANDQQ
jgi:hypothetical protein